MTEVVRTEARILKSNSVLVALSPLEDEKFLPEFCGSVIIVDDLSTPMPSFSGKTVYLCGDVSMANDLNFDSAERVLVIRELSRGYSDDNVPWPIVDLRRVPVLLDGVGVYYRRWFDPSLIDC